MAFWVYEAEYVNNGPNNSCDWKEPIPDTVELRGPFETLVEATEVGMSRMWNKVDKYYHRAAVVTDPAYDPTDPATHHMVHGAEQYWA